MTHSENLRPDNDNTPPIVANSGAANDNGLSFISMFSGIDAASVAFTPLGWKAICFSEVDRAASAVLAYHYPDVPNVGDMSKHDWSQYRGKVDIVCGGPPCQAFSVAGLRDGLNDARGNLSLEYMKALHAIEPRNAIVENVPGWLTMADNAFGCFLAGVVGASAPFVPTERKPADGKSSRWWRWAAKERCHAVRWPSYGMVSGPKGRAAWAVKDAQFFGLAQRRERVLVVADFGRGADPAAVLFERVGVPWNPPARGEAREGVAGTTESGARGYSESGQGWWREDIAGLRSQPGGMPENVAAYAPELARCDATREGSSQDYESTTMVVSATGEVAPVCFTAKDYGGDASVDIAPTLRAGTHNTSHQNGGVTPAVTVALRGREGGGTAELGGSVATALRASSGGGDKPHVLTSAVRRLTPRECERLQGFPDDYTRIPIKKYPAKKVTRLRPDDMWELIDGEWWLMQADGPRYKQLGNSWAVPKFRWLGERIAKHMPPLADNDNQSSSQFLPSRAATAESASHA